MGSTPKFTFNEINFFFDKSTKNLKFISKSLHFRGKEGGSRLIWKKFIFWFLFRTVMRQSWNSHETVMWQSWYSLETVMRQSWDSHETVYYSIPVAGFADISVLVCSVRWSMTSVTFQQGGRMAMAFSLRRGQWQKRSTSKFYIFMKKYERI